MALVMGILARWSLPQFSWLLYIARDQQLWP
jgi:hypothetical protein